MKDKSYAVVALKDILIKALGAVESYAAGSVTDGWDLEFAEMSREAQVEWLLHLFEVLAEYG